MFGEAWAMLALKVMTYVTDEQGLAKFKKQLAIESLKKEIKDAVACKDFVRAADALVRLQRLSDAP